MVIDTASASQSLGQFTRELSGLHREVIEGIFQRARDRGEFSGDVEPLSVTDLLYGAGLFFALGRRLDHRQVEEEELASRVTDVVSVILDGLV